MGLMGGIRGLLNRKRAVSFAFSSGYDNAEWTPKDYEKYAKETYLKNVIAYRCIDEVAKSTASVPWGLFRKKKSGKSERIYEHDIVELIERPNPDESFEFLLLKWQAFLLMAGNSFLERLSPITGPNKDIPKEFHILRPDRMKILKSEGHLAGFKYTVDNRETSWYVDPVTRQCDVLQFKTFNPIDDWWGASVTESVAREIDTGNEQVEWNKKLMENEGRPGMIITVTGKLSPKAFEHLEKTLRDKYGGSSGAGKNLILEGDKGTKAEPYGWSPMDLDFIEGGREIARRTCNGYNVPPQLVGVPGDSKFNNYQEARLHFYEGPIFWYLKFFRGEINNWLFSKKDRLYLDFVTDEVPALSPQREVMWKRAQSSNFLTINEKRALVHYKPVEGGDAILQPSNMMPLEDLSMGTVEEVEEEIEEEDKNSIIKLLEEGYSEEQANEMIGV